MHRSIKKALVLSMALVLCFVFYGCGKEEESPTKVADEFLKSIKNSDQDAIKKVYKGKAFDPFAALKLFEDDNESGSPDSYVSKDLLPKAKEFDYKISEEKIDGDKATVNLKITSYNIAGFMVNWITDYMQTASEQFADSTPDDSQMEQMLKESYENQKSTLKKDLKKDVKLNLVKDDGKWKVNTLKKHDELFNAINGGVIDLSKKIAEDLENSENGED